MCFSYLSHIMRFMVFFHDPKAPFVFRALLICTATVLTVVYVYRLVVTFANQKSLGLSSDYLPVLHLSINKKSIVFCESSTFLDCLLLIEPTQTACSTGA